MADEANINILHITAVEGLVTMMNDHLGVLTEETVEKANMKLKTMKVLAEWQKTSLHDLRKVYE